MQIEYFLNIEECLIKKKLLGDENLSTFEHVDDKQLKIAHKLVHALLVNYLIHIYVCHRLQCFSINDFSQYFEGEVSSDEILNEINIEYDLIPQICEKLHIIYLNTVFSVNKKGIIRKKSKNNLIENGAVYTQDEIAYSIVDKTLKGIEGNISDAKILDFATGTGRFYRQIIKCLQKHWKILPEESVMNNIYAIDLDPIAINICRLNALTFINSIDKEKLGTISRHIICKNALIKNLLYEDSLKDDDLDSLYLGKFDAVVSNPPYLVLKPNKRKMDAQTVENINMMAKYFRTSHDYHYSIEGMLNLYQLSLEAMVSMIKNKGQMGIICPSTLFADVSASMLRRYLLKNHCVYYIKYFSEDDPLFDNVTQATCIFHLIKGIPTSDIKFVKGDKHYTISIEDVKSVFSTNWEIPSVEKVEWNILKKLKSCKKLKEYKDIRNKRGELDLSLYSKFITKERTDYRLVRGNMFSDSGLKDINHEYVLPDFLDIKSEDFLSNDFGRRRLICQQISNQLQRVRLHFVYSNKNDILGNSCNYISAPNDCMVKLHVLLNSALLNWRFKVTSTNNHINNYELDELPIIDLDLLTKEVLDLDEVKRDKKICALYGLRKEEIDFIIKQHYEAI